MDTSSASLAFAQGFAASAGLIIAIGAQNAFVLTQGLLRRFHWQVAALCSLIDALLITAGVLGLGWLIRQSPLLLQAATWGGVLFLAVYGALALKAALHPGALRAEQRGAANLPAALLTTLALSLLNPHVYLDTLILLGTIGGRLAPTAQPWFTGGAVLASLCWFFTLAFSARALAPLFRHPQAWRILDLIVCLLMWSVALALLLSDMG
ncbi:LysE/ArgO family amino acid transporter [Motiliproteus sediminis]|uniref:LysE/ArgO family amino acid transporter n=1 Tax=Motiliproteus sediminis TaxID=1468178 RepID=UPI001AEFE019|nr:LysE/ArgO family amino acid transporter [Motiliproteus sediminis]